MSEKKTLHRVQRTSPLSSEEIAENEHVDELIERDVPELREQGRELFQRRERQRALLDAIADTSSVSKDRVVAPAEDYGPALQNVRSLRERSLADVAERTASDKAAVARLEAGDANPTLAELRRYAEALGMKLAIVMLDDSKPQ